MIRDKQIKRADRGKRHSGFSAVGIISLLRKINFVELSEEGGPLNKLTGQIWRKKKKNQRKKVLWFLSHKKLNLKLNSLLSKQPINIHRFFFNWKTVNFVSYICKMKPLTLTTSREIWMVRSALLESRDS